MMLSALLIVPGLGMGALLLVPKTQVRLIRGIAAAVTLLTLLIAAKLLLSYDARAVSMQFEEKLAWIPQLNAFYHLGVDGLSIAMVGLTALLAFLACLASFGITERVKEYFVLYLLLEVGMLGTFLALDLFLFYIFW